MSQTVIDSHPGAHNRPLRFDWEKAEIEGLLAQNRQQLAFEPADLGELYGAQPGNQTVGGVLAANLSGPRRIKAGAARDHFLGFSAVTGRGEEVKSGGRVVKNVTGYDLCKLMAGSYGTLGVLTHVTLKVLPVPEKSWTVLAFGLDDAGAVQSVRVGTVKFRRDTAVDQAHAHGDVTWQALALRMKRRVRRDVAGQTLGHNSNASPISSTCFSI